MKTNLRLATAACATVVALGMVGCGGSSSSTPPPAPPVVEGVPAYATPVDVNETKVKKVLGFMYHDGFIANSVSSAEPLDLKTIGYEFKAPKEFIYIFEKLFRTFLYFGGGAQDGYPIEKVAMVAMDTESGETDMTMDCAYGGSFTLGLKWAYSDSGPVGEENVTMNIGFDNCVHNTPLLEEALGYMTADDYRFAYDGSLDLVMEAKEVLDMGKFTFVFEAKGLTEKVTNNGINERIADMNAKIGLLMEGSHNYLKFAFDMNGVMNSEEFDENGTSAGKLAFESKDLAIEFQNIEGSDIDRTNFDMDGYMGMAETNSSGDVKKSYIYGKDIAVNYVWDDSPASGHITSNTFSGTLGLPCLSGAVDIATATTWETNSTQEDLAGNPGRTPFVGTTTISGANDTVATVSFHQNSATPKASYGSISIEGVTVDYDTLGDMTEPCDMVLINP